jgi:hypothetical protein
MGLFRPELVRLREGGFAGALFNRKVILLPPSRLTGSGFNFVP